LALSASTRVAQAQEGQGASGLPRIQYVLDNIEIEGNEKSARSLLVDAIDLPLGEPIDLRDLEGVRLRLLGTGYFTQVEAALRKGQERGHVTLWVRVVERNTITLADVFLGSSRRSAFWGGLDVVEGNAFGRGQTLGGAFVLGKDQYAGRLRLGSPNLLGVPVRSQAELRYAQGREAIFVREALRPLPPGLAEPQDLVYRRLGGEAGIGFYPFALLSVFLDMGLEHIEADSALPTRTAHYLKEGSSWHLPLRLTLDHDTRDNPLVPTAGYRLNFSVEGSDTLWSDYSYLKMVLRVSYHRSLGFGAPGHVLRFNMISGMILGQAPFFERFFVGDTSTLVQSRALGLNFTTQSSPDFLSRGAGNLGYESVLVGGGVEYGVPIIQGEAPLYRVEFFIGLGVFGMTTLGDLPQERVANLAVDLMDPEGVSSFPVDLIFDVGFRAETPIGIFGLSFANGLALVPF
jgi:outer membrane protein assembly factor BamA